MTSQSQWNKWITGDRDITVNKWGRFEALDTHSLDWLRPRTNHPTDWLTDQQTNSIEQSLSWEADTSLASQEIPRILWNPMFTYRAHKSSAPSVLSRINPIHDFQSYVFTIPFNIILQTTLRYYRRFCLSGILIKALCEFLFNHYDSRNGKKNYAPRNPKKVSNNVRSEVN